MTVHQVFFSLSDNFSVDSASCQRLPPHEGRRYQGIASETLSSKADQKNTVLG